MAACTPTTEPGGNTRILEQAIATKNVQQARIALTRGANMSNTNPDAIPLLRVTSVPNGANPTPDDTMAKELVIAGAPLHVTDTAGNTPVHCAVKHGNVRLTLLLLKNGAPVNVHNNFHQTPLDIAIGNRHRVLANILRHNNAQVTNEQMQDLWFFNLMTGRNV